MLICAIGHPERFIKPQPQIALSISNAHRSTPSSPPPHSILYFAFCAVLSVVVLGTSPSVALRRFIPTSKGTANIDILSRSDLVLARGSEYVYIEGGSGLGFLVQCTRYERFKRLKL